MTAFKGLLLPVLLLIWWWSASALQLVNSYLIPSPESVLYTAGVLFKKGILLHHMETSLHRVFIGFGLTFLLAFPLAVLLGMNRKFEAYFEPVLHFIRHIPPIACIPLLILWLGIDEASKLAVIVLAAFFPIFLNAREGIVRCDPKLIEVGKAFGFSRKKQFWKIVLPSALPAIILGMRLGLGYSWRALIGAELIAASAGIGYMIIEAEQLSRPDTVIVGILVIGLLGYMIDYGFSQLVRLLLPWNREKGIYDDFSSKGAL